MSWETKEPDDLTLKQLNQLCEEYVSYRAQKKEAEARVKDIETEISKRANKIIEFLTEYGMKNFDGPFGKVSVMNRYSVRQPNTPENKEAFYNYLKEKGDFDHLISVNSRTLQSYVKHEIEAQKQEGNFDFVPPGLEKPEIVQTISLRKA